MERQYLSTGKAQHNVDDIAYYYSLKSLFLTFFLKPSDAMLPTPYACPSVGPLASIASQSALPTDLVFACLSTDPSVAPSDAMLAAPFISPGVAFVRVLKDLLGTISCTQLRLAKQKLTGTRFKNPQILQLPTTRVVGTCKICGFLNLLPVGFCLVSLNYRHENFISINTFHT